ncbi:hypothetical protein GLE_1064 [Lysobacter enzymogenes]|uniref:Uncharacterized protein n=1 Tax=Lysobacter enzymogenes TaxID=69 RepID=A0A0S2DD17_LYSEN|nr:hypothetical protein GLE_1064 [Lysobacter enzymogenes]
MRRRLLLPGLRRRPALSADVPFLSVFVFQPKSQARFHEPP